MFRKTIFLIVLSLIGSLSGGVYGNVYSPKVGESLEYKVIVKSMMHGADQTIKVLSKGVIHNREVVNIQSVMTTVGLIGSLAKYSEKEDLVLDSTGLFPWHIRREVHDGDKILIEDVTFDYARQTAIRIFTRNGGTPERTELKLPEYVQDGLSLQFYLRKGNFVNGPNKVIFYSNGAMEETVYTVKEVKETLRLDCGTYKNFLQVDHPKSGIIILLDTIERMPLVIRKNASFGKIEAKLVKIN